MHEHSSHLSSERDLDLIGSTQSWTNFSPSREGIHRVDDPDANLQHFPRVSSRSTGRVASSHWFLAGTSVTLNE